MRRTLVDTLATIVFFTTFATLTELFVGGLSPREVLTTRLLMIPIMIATGRPYTAWRDWIFARRAPRSPWAKALTDAVAFVTFQLPVYAGTLVIAGASSTQIAVLLAAALPQMLILSRPFGLFVEAMHRLARVG